MSATLIDLRARRGAVASQLERCVTLDLILLVSHVAIAAVFFLSGRTKVEGLLDVTPGAVALFREEFRLLSSSPG